MLKDVRIINSNNKIVYYKEFQDLDDFLRSILDERINPIFRSYSSVSNSKSFSGTSTYEEAWNLCRFTWNQGFEEFYSLFKRMNYKFQEFSKIINYFSPVGYTPSVPRYLKGIPTTMYSYKEEKQEQIVNIYLNTAYSCFQNQNQIINRGILILNLINYLETQNIKVNLYNYLLVKEKNEIDFIVIPIKNQYEKLNIKKCYFPLVHPAFFRRLCFRVLELLPVKNFSWDNGYGIPMLHAEVEDFFYWNNKNKLFHKNDFDKEKTIIISTPEELGITGENLTTDCESFIKKLNTKYQIFDKDQDEQKNKQKRRKV